MFYRRTRRHDIPLVTELRVLPDKETPSPFSSAWNRVAHPINPAGEKRYLWYKTDRTWRDMTEAERRTDIVTEIDVLFGSDEPWYGFDRANAAAFDGTNKKEPVWLTYRKGVKRACNVTLPMRFGSHTSQLLRVHHHCISRATGSSRSCRSPTSTTPSAWVPAETPS